MAEKFNPYSDSSDRDVLDETIDFRTASSPGPTQLVPADHSSEPVVMVENVSSQDFCNDFFQKSGVPHSGLTQIEETAASIKNADGSEMRFLRRHTSFTRTPEATKQNQQHWQTSGQYDTPLSRRSSAFFTDQLLGMDLPPETQNMVYPVSSTSYPPPRYPSNYPFDEAFSARVNGALLMSFEKYKDSVTHPRYLFDSQKNTLYVMPGHSVCIFLGVNIPELVGATVRAYVVYDDAASRHKLVTTCKKHTAPENNLWQNYYIRSNDAGVVRFQDSPADPLAISFPNVYTNETPSISTSFVCNNSCLGRSRLRLVVDVDVGQIRFSRFVLLRVCSNPGRDARTTTAEDVTEKFKTFKESLSVQKRATVMKRSFMKNAKRMSTQDLREMPDELGDETTKVYTIYICGKDNYNQMIRHAHLLCVEERHYCSSKRPSGLRSTQISDDNSVSSWLQLMDKENLMPHFTNNNIMMMADLLDRYTPKLFQSLGIPIKDIISLNISFVNWMNVTLASNL